MDCRGRRAKLVRGECDEPALYLVRLLQGDAGIPLVGEEAGAIEREPSE